jgi:hypothetical protein
MPELNRIEINRENAQHSTGPVTEAGKKKVSLNALRHGLTSQLVVMPSEDLEAYKAHLQSLLDEYHPASGTEAILVQTIADASWRMHRAAAMETNLLTLGSAFDPDDLTLRGAAAMVAALESRAKALSSLSMHTQRLSRQFEKSVIQLRALQEIRRMQEQVALDKLLDITEMSKSTGETYHPAADGFVFTDLQITAARQARNRDLRSAAAYKYRQTVA